MTSAQKAVVILNPFQIDFREGLETIVFKTDTDEEVLFQRNKQGQVIKTNPVQVEGVSLAQARILASQNLANHVLEKGAYHETKVVPAQYWPKPNQTAVFQVKPPTWMSMAPARAHALRIDPHEKDD